MKRTFGLGTVILCLVSTVAAFAQEADPTLESYYMANALYNRGSYELAAAEYKAFLDKNPTNAKAPLARYGLGLSLYARDQFKEAEAVFSVLVAEGKAPDQAHVYNLLGSCSLALGKDAEAVEAFGWTIKNSQDKGRLQDALIGATEGQYRQRKWDQVITLSEAVEKLAPNSAHLVRARLQGAVARYEKKDYERAAETFEAILKDHKGTPLAQHATYLLGECKRLKNDLDGAAVLYEECSKAAGSPYQAQAAYRLGFTRFAQGKYDLAAQVFTQYQQAYPKDPMLPQAGLYLGRSYLELKNYPQAAAILGPLAANPDVAGAATLWLAKTYARQKQFAEVEKTLTPAAEKLAKDALLPEILYELANAQLQQDNFAGAAATFAKVVAAAADKPYAADALWLQAYALHRLQKYDESLALCEKFLAAYPKHANAPDVTFLQAENLFLTDKLDAALPVYQAFVQANPKHEHAQTAQLRIGQGLYGKGRWKETLDALAPFAKEMPKDPVYDQVLFLIGDARYRTDDWAGAITAFEQFVREKPQQPNVDTALFKTALAAEHKPDPAKAVAALQALLQGHPKSVHLAPAQVELGRLQYEAKQYPAARAALDAPAKAGDPEALYYLGWVALADGKDAEAAECFSAVAKKTPNHALAADAALQQGILQVRVKAFPLAQATLSALLQAQPKHPKLDQVLFYLGLSAARQSQWDAAQPPLQRVLAEFPASTVAERALYEIAWCEKGRKQPAAAMTRYAEFLKTFPKSPLAEDVSFELAELEFEAKKYDDAIARLEKLLPAVAANKDLKERVLYRLGWSQFSKDAMEPAAKAFETLLAENPQSPLAVVSRYQAGEARLKMSLPEQAYPHFQAAVAAGAQTPVHEQALLRLGEVEGLTNRWADAEKSCTAFLTQYPKSALAPRAQFGLGWALENQKKYEPAVAAYRQVVAAGQGDPLSARSQFQIGECFFFQDKYEDAIRELTRVEVKYNYPDWSSKSLLEVGRVLEKQGKKDEAAARYKELIGKYADTDAAAAAKALLAKIEGK